MRPQSAVYGTLLPLVLKLWNSIPGHGMRGEGEGGWNMIILSRYASDGDADEDDTKIQGIDKKARWKHKEKERKRKKVVFPILKSNETNILCLCKQHALAFCTYFCLFT